MKTVVGFLAIFFLAIACQESEQVSEFTGNETIYALQKGSDYEVSGILTLKERKDGTTTVLVELSGTEGTVKHPVHLHLGDLSVPGADVAALLSPVIGSTGKSETRVDKLADETTITYADLIKINACVKIHLSDTGAERDIILAAGNIGTAVSKNVAGGRVGVSVCKSE
ncbi:MAG: hypothetical protein AABY93_16840 [Bacteroidota bacterium]